MPTLTIQPGTTILVTGANGLIGSHIIDQLLARKYNVRGVVRDVKRDAWLSEYFMHKHKEAKFELVSVPDMTVEGCYDEVVKGTDGFVHVASPLNGDDPAVVIPTAVNGCLNALKASANTPSIKRFVFTSSSIAATMPRPNVEFEINDQSWNDVVIQKGWNHPEDEPAALKGWYLYGALKTETEKAAWKFMKEEDRGFVFNAVLPNCNFSKVLVPEKQGTPSTIGWAKAAFTGENFEHLKNVVTPQYFISTQDDALLHVSALIHSDVTSERLLGFAEPFNWKKILTLFKRYYPDRTFPDGPENEGEDKSSVRSERAKQVLGWVKDGQGWDGLEASLKETAEMFVEDMKL